MSNTLIRRACATVALGLAAALTLSAAPAQAATIDVDYDVTGTTRIASTGSSIALGPAVMHSFVETDGQFTGDMQLPGTRTEFKVLGLVPVTANVDFEPVGPTTGSVIRTPDRKRILQSTSTYYVRLSNIKAGILPLFAGKNCRTSDPVVIAANTPEGELFDIASGGNLTGTYSIGDFENCGLNTWLINLLVPGDGNSINLTLANGRLAQ